MDEEDSSWGVNRRDVLKYATVGGASLGLSGRSIAQNNRKIIGTKSKRAVQKAKDKASTVDRVINFGSIGKAVVGEFPASAAQSLQSDSDVRYVENDGQMKAIGQTMPWGVDRVDSDVVHDEGKTGDGADIAILDTGIDSDHPDLAGNLGEGKSYYTCDSECTGNSCHEPWDDDYGHGTHCAGIADAINNSEGVVGNATEATLHAIKVLSCDGYGSYSAIADGVVYAADKGWDVASMSLGGSTSSSSLKDACQYAVNQGTMVVAAAGNDGSCTDCLLYPAKYDSTIAVSATDSGDDLAYFSSTGPEVELAAPGVNILSTYTGGNYYEWSGTSMACPHVSGAAGILMANGYTNTEARARLAETAEDIGLSENEQGNGLLDTEAAVGTDTTNPYNVATKEVENLSGTSATLVGELTGMGNADEVELRFKYWEKGKKRDTSHWVDVKTVTEPTVYTSNVEGLSEGTTYIVSARANSKTEGEDAGDEIAFTTESFNIGEVGSIIPPDEKWNGVVLDNTYDNPVVIMKPVSYNYEDPCHIRLRNVQSDRFEFRIEEWSYLDGSHGPEQIRYMVVESGTHELSDGTRVEAGTTTGNHQFTDVSFDHMFDLAPVSFSQCQTYNGPHPVVTRNRNVSNDGFETRLQEEEGQDGWHTDETIGYVAFQPNAGTSDGTKYEVGRADKLFDHQWNSVMYEQDYKSPHLVADMETTNGGNTCGLRWKNITSRGCSLMVEEEQSSNKETNHVGEEIGYFVFDGGGTLK